MKCQCNLCRASMCIGKEELRRITCVRDKTSDRVDWKISIWFWYVIMMTKRVCQSNTEGRRTVGRPSLRWLALDKLKKARSARSLVLRVVKLKCINSLQWRDYTKGKMAVSMYKVCPSILSMQNSERGIMTCRVSFIPCHICSIIHGL